MANNFTYQVQQYHTGDTVKLHLSVAEADKTRTQVFEGIIIAIKNAGSGQSITVRKIATSSIGVERIVPLQNPNLTKIELKTAGKVRRAKLYYLRDRIGKRATKVKSIKITSQNKKTIATNDSKPKSSSTKKASPAKDEPKTDGKPGRTASKKTSKK